jgi:hypothetical protein
MPDTFISTATWHSLAASIAATFEPDGGEDAIERAKLILCGHAIWPLSIATDVETNVRSDS